MKISRERIEQIREYVDVHIFPVGTIADLLTAVDEAHEMIARMSNYLLKVEYILNPSEVNELVVPARQFLRGTKWGKANG